MRVIAVLTVLVVVAVLAAAGYRWARYDGSVASVEPQSGPAPDVHKTVAHAQRLVAVILKDPYSVVFDTWWAIPITESGQNMQLACGRVNAKNSFGAYIGNQVYYVAIHADGKSDICSGENLSEGCAALISDGFLTRCVDALVAAHKSGGAKR